MDRPRDRFKVVVLDEVHRLSRQAFDALLKIVEEPPPHLVFIFATTEIDTVPATILSRCQEFQFRRVPSPVLAQHLRRLSDAETITVSDAALRMIARAGEGSVRDSVALLDQLATFGNSEISDRDASNLLGGLDAAIFLRVLSAILDGNAPDVTETVREIEANGWDPHNVFGQFLVYTRDALHLAIGGQPETIDLPLEEAEALANLVSSQSYENLLRLSDHMLMSEPIVRRSEFALLALELAWLRAAELPKLTRIEDLLSGDASAPAVKPQKITATKSTPVQKSRNQIPSPAKTPLRHDPQPTQPPPSTAVASSDSRPGPMTTPGGSGNKIDLFRESLNHRSQPLTALIESAKLEFKSGQLLVHPPPGDTLISSALQRENNVSLFNELIQKIWGKDVTWAIQETSANDKPDADPGQSITSTKGADDDPIVRTVLDVFGGNIQNVQHQENRENTS